MAKSIEIPEEVMAEIKKHEVKYTVIEEFAEPLKYFADWANQKTQIIAEIYTNSCKHCYLCNHRGKEIILDLWYKLYAKRCSQSNVMLRNTEFTSMNKGVFRLQSTCKQISAFRVSNYEKDNKQKVFETKKKYRNRSPHIFRNIYNKRRLVSSYGYSDSQFLAEFENSPTRTCWLSEYSTEEGKEVHIEHLMPITINNQKPYGNSETNCYYLLGPLNSSKGNKNVFDWIDSMSHSHLQFLLEDSPVELNLQEFREGMFRIITGLAEKQGLTFDQYKEQYNRDYAEGLHEKAS